MKTKSKRYFSYTSISLGAVLIFVINKESTEHPYYLIAGIIFLMLGLYLVGSSLGSRPDNQDSYLKSEDGESEKS